MGTHDDINRAGPQNEFISGFKGGAISQGKDPQRSFSNHTGKARGSTAPPKPGLGLKGRNGSNPYQLTQLPDKNTSVEQSVDDAFSDTSAESFLTKIKYKLFNEQSGESNAKQKAMIVMIPILFVIMIFMFRQVFSKTPRNTRGATKDNNSVVVNKDSENEIVWNIPEPLPGTMRDPIRYEPNKSANTGQGEVLNVSKTGITELRSILFSDDKPSVFIGDKLVYLNQTINGFTLVEIHKDFVVFEKNGKRWTQKVTEEGPQSTEGEDVQQNVESVEVEQDIENNRLSFEKQNNNN